MSHDAPEPADEEVLLWTVEQVCRALACRPSWLYDQVEGRRFPVVRLGRQLRFRPADVNAYLNAQTQPSHERPSTAVPGTGAVPAPSDNRPVQPTDLIVPAG